MTELRPTEGEGAEPSWRSGIVEIEIEDDVRPELASGGLELTGGGSEPLAAVNDALQRLGAERIEPSFAAVEEPAEELFEQGSAVPSLRNFLRVHFAPGADVEEIAATLSTLPPIKRAAPVPTAIPPGALPNEPLLGDNDQLSVDPLTGLERQWYIFRCRADAAWKLHGDNETVVADIDFGYRLTHRELANQFELERAYNSFDGSSNVSHGEHVGHGTGVFGLAAASVNREGIAGFAHRARLWPVQANDGGGPALGGDEWARAIEWVRQADSGGRRKVIILEVQTGAYGNYEMVPSVNAAIRRAVASQAVVCVAAGNGNRSAEIGDDGAPIPPTGSILVGATSFAPSENPRARFSNFGSNLVVAAPGDGAHDVTCAATADDAYTNQFGGTSGATPKVAGTAAMMLAADATLTHDDVRAIVSRTGSEVKTEPHKPVGTFLDAGQAMNEVGEQVAQRRPRLLRVPAVS